MLITSGDNLLEMKLIDLKKEYTPVYLLLGVYFLLSMLSTHDIASQLISCLRFTVTGLFALWVVQWYDVKHILRFTCWAQSVIVLLCLLFMFIPSQGWAVVDGARCFVGIFPGKNVCGAELAFGLTMQVALLRLYWADNEQPSAFFYLIMLCQLVMLLLTRAMGSLLSAGLPIAALLLTHEKRGSMIAANTIVVATLITRLLNLQHTSFLFINVYWPEVNILQQCLSVLLPLVIFVLGVILSLPVLPKVRALLARDARTERIGEIAGYALTLRAVSAKFKVSSRYKLG